MTLSSLRHRIERLERARTAETRERPKLTDLERATAMQAFYHRVGQEAGADLAEPIDRLRHAIRDGEPEGLRAALAATAGTLERML